MALRPALLNIEASVLVKVMKTETLHLVRFLLNLWKCVRKEDFSFRKNTVE